MRKKLSDSQRRNQEDIDNKLYGYINENFKKNPQIFKVGDKVKLSDISRQFDMVRLEDLSPNVCYTITSEYTSLPNKINDCEQHVDIDISNMSFPSWCFIPFDSKQSWRDNIKTIGGVTTFE